MQLALVLVVDLLDFLLLLVVVLLLLLIIPVLEEKPRILDSQVLALVNFHMRVPLLYSLKLFLL